MDPTKQIIPKSKLKKLKHDNQIELTRVDQEVVS